MSVSASTKAVYDLVIEPQYNCYRQLILHALGWCSSFQIVVRHNLPTGLGVTQLLDKLRFFLISKSEEHEWPGTRLLDETATVYRYRFCRESASIMVEVAERLFAWIQPNLPEDLCLLRFDGSPWLVTIAHESDGYLILTRKELRNLVSTIPCLSLNERPA